MALAIFEAADRVQETDHTESSAPGRPSLRAGDGVALAVAVVASVGFLGLSAIPLWSPRFAAVLILAPVGAIFVTRRLRAHDPAASIAVCAIAWAVFAAAWQSTPWVRLLGMLGGEASVLIMAAGVGAWAIGRAQSGAGRTMLVPTLLASLGLCGLVGLVQVALGVESGPLSIPSGRAHGLTTHPVYFGALMSGAAVLLTGQRVVGRLSLLQPLGVGALAAASTLSGSRGALVAMCMGVIVVAIRRRDLAGLACVAAVGIGTAAGTWLSAATGRGGSSLERLAAGSSQSGDLALVGGGMRWRLDVWKIGWRAFLDRPITGWGFGNFREAAQLHLPAQFGDTDPLFDSHNVVVELLVAVGLPGFVLFAVFAVFVVLHARGPLAIAAGTIASTWLLEPIAISTLLLVMLLLGAATPVAEDTLSNQRSDRWVHAALVAATGIAVSFMVADARLAAASNTGDAAAMESAARWFPNDPVVADAVSHQWTSVTVDDDHVKHGLAWAQRAVEREPGRASRYDWLARHQIYLGDLAGARASLERAIELQQNRVVSWELLYRLATDFNDPALAERAMERLCLLGADSCEPRTASESVTPQRS